MKVTVFGHAIIRAGNSLSLSAWLAGWLSSVQTPKLSKSPCVMTPVVQQVVLPDTCTPITLTHTDQGYPPPSAPSHHQGWRPLPPCPKCSGPSLDIPRLGIPRKSVPSGGFAGNGLNTIGKNSEIQKMNENDVSCPHAQVFQLSRFQEFSR